MAITILCFMLALMFTCAAWAVDNAKLLYVAAVFICVGYGIIAYQVNYLF